MSSLRAWGVRFSGLFGKERKDRELAEELESHLQMHVEDNVRAGMSSWKRRVRRDALIKLGGIEATKERFRQQRGDFPFGKALLKNLGLRRPLVAQKSWPHRRRRSHPGARCRREHGDFYRGLRDAAGAVALSTA